MSFWARNNTYAPHPKIGVPVLIYAKNDAKEEKEKENFGIFSPNLSFLPKWLLLGRILN